MKIFAIIVALLVVGTTGAQTPTPSSTREINQLFVALESSRCEFYRNGSWYTAEKASAHLRRKYDVLIKKHLVVSTESFIDLAATQSSMSGEPYQVRCVGSPAVSSHSWFTGKLDELRRDAAD